MAPRIVFDGMVFLQGAVNESGPAFACLRLAEIGTVKLLLSPGIPAEMTEVLSRPLVRKKIKTLTDIPRQLERTASQLPHEAGHTRGEGLLRSLAEPQERDSCGVPESNSNVHSSWRLTDKRPIGDNSARLRMANTL